MPDPLTAYLDALERDECYRVDAVLKESTSEVTQRVFFVTSDGLEQGPYVRKYIENDSGLGETYERVWEAERAGQEFMHLPHIFDCYNIDDKRAVIMEYVDGETLGDVVYRCDPSLALAHDIFPRICDAVSELHERFDPPIIHRDLKPSNIMLSNNSLIIIDLGIARSFKAEAEEDTRHFGTRAYAPPEQFGFGQTDVRSDVYALGMLLYFCLTEHTPTSSVRKNEFRDSRVPEQLRLVILRATALDPNERYANVRELQDAYYHAVGLSTPPNLSGAGSSAQRVTYGKSMGVDHARGARQPQSAPGRLLAKIPFAVGLIWDLFLLLIFVLGCINQGQLIYDSFSLAAAVNTAALNSLAWFYMFEHLTLTLLLVLPLLYLVCDRRPIARLIPAFGRISLSRDIVITVVVFIIGAILYTILNSIVSG